MLSFWTVCAVQLVQATSASAQVMKRFQDPRPIIIGHRGCWRVTSENSLSGLKVCAEHGIDMVEVDVRETKDGVLVLMHDDTLDRTTDLKGRMDETTLAQLKTGHLLRGAGGPGAAVTEEAPPTFVEELRAAKGRVILYMDVKSDSDVVFQHILDMIQQEGAEDWVVFPAAAAEWNKLPAWVQQRAMLMAIDCNVGVTGAECSTTLAQALEKNRGLRPLSTAVLFKTDAYLAGGATVAAAVGTRLCVWSVSSPKWDGGKKEENGSASPNGVWGEFLKQGFSVFETNDPITLSDYLKSHSAVIGKQ